VRAGKVTKTSKHPNQKKKIEGVPNRPEEGFEERRGGKTSTNDEVKAIKKNFKTSPHA